MSSTFYCTFSKEQTLTYGIPSGGWIELHANNLEDAHQIGTKWFPATRRLPFGGFAAIYTGEELGDKLRAGYFKTGKLGVANKTHMTWTFINGGTAA